MNNKIKEWIQNKACYEMIEIYTVAGIVWQGLTRIIHKRYMIDGM
jgi:hypothetical protein